MQTTNVDAYHLGPDAALEVLEGMGVRMRWLARSEETSGRFNLAVYTAPPRFPGPGLHAHPAHDEIFYVLDGELRIQVGDEQTTLPAGSFAFGPRGTPHTFANHTHEPTRYLFGFVPGGMEEMFREMMAYINESSPAIDPQKLGRINAEHGVELLGPPMPVPE